MRFKGSYVFYSPASQVILEMSITTVNAKVKLQKEKTIGLNIDMKEPNTSRGPLRRPPSEIPDDPESKKAGPEATFSPPTPLKNIASRMKCKIILLSTSSGWVPGEPSWCLQSSLAFESWPKRIWCNQMKSGNLVI